VSLKLLLFCVEEKAKWTDIKDLALILLRERAVVPSFNDGIAETDKLNRLNLC
jgi:hypothetical protein